MQGVESCLLWTRPGPRVILVSEENNGCDDVGVIRNKLVIEVHKSQKGVNTLNRRGGFPILDGREFHRIYVDKALSDNHTEIFHGGGVEGAF